MALTKEQIEEKKAMIDSLEVTVESQKHQMKLLELEKELSVERTKTNFYVRQIDSQMGEFEKQIKLNERNIKALKKQLKTGKEE